MTIREEQKIRNKIAKIKKALADDKKHWGGSFHDGYGYRFLQPELYLALQDFKGAARYFNWYEKNFPEDMGPALFLFEWSIILFKLGKIKEAEKKVLLTFFSDYFLVDAFIEKESVGLDPEKLAKLKIERDADPLPYKRDQEHLKDFAEWLDNFVQTERFQNIANEYFEIEIKLIDEPVGKKRSQLVDSRYHMLDNY